MLRTLTTSANFNLSLTSPFTSNSLNNIKEILSLANAKRIVTPYDRSERNAAVLIPFCNVDEIPGVLLEVRGRLRTHSGEVR